MIITTSTRKKNTLKNYELLHSKFSEPFAERDVGSITTEEILTFLTHHTEGTKQSTKRLHFSLLSSFFTFLRNSVDPDLANPCDSPVLRKLFRDAKPNQWKILEKDLVDEMIFRTEDQRNRLMLELMARSGMRVGEVLKLRAGDIDDRKLVLRDPKSGRQAEVVFLPQKVADRLKRYIRDNHIEPEKRIFPLTYPAAYSGRFRPPIPG